MKLARWLVWRAERKKVFSLCENGQEREGGEGTSLERASESYLLVRRQCVVP